MSDLLFGSFLRGPRRRGPVPRDVGRRHRPGRNGPRVSSTPSWRGRSMSGSSGEPGPGGSVARVPHGGASHRVSMMAEATAGLDHDEIEPERQVGQERTVRQGATLEESIRRRPDSRSLPMVDGLLRQAEIAVGPPADLDRNERPRWPGVHSHEIQFVPANMHVPCQDRPAGRRQTRRDELFRSVTGSLSIGAHAGNGSQPRISRAYPAPTSTNTSSAARDSLSGSSFGSSPNRSSETWSPASVRCRARNERRWNGVNPRRRMARRCSRVA